VGTQQEGTPEKWKQGAPAGNANGMRHGGRTKRLGLILTDLRKKYPHVAFSVCSFRKAIWSHTARADGTLAFGVASLVDLTCTYHMTARVAEHRAATGESENPVTDLKTACWAKAQRQACLARLGITPEAAEALGADEPEHDAEAMYVEEQGQAGPPV
jgi:hypothetical protein